MKNVLALALLFAGFTFADGVSSQVVGKWTQVGGPDRIEFRVDGNYVGAMTYGYAQTLKGLAGGYAFNGERIALVLDGVPIVVAKVKLTSETLVVTYIDGGPVKFDGATEVFRRAK
jgi:hypothetical protein